MSEVRSNRLGSISVGTLQLMLTPRDIAIVRSIREFKFLGTKHIHALHFGDHASYASGIRACTRVLARLREHRLIYRLDRPIGGGGGGSTSYAWGVDVAGDRLIRSCPDSDGMKRFRAYQPTPLFLAHTLAVADVRVTLEALQRAGRLEIVNVKTEPSNWQRFPLAGRVQILKPDLFIVTARGDHEWIRYIEVDRGTESLQTLLAKCRVYEAWADTGADIDTLGVIPEVLWLVPSRTRATRFSEEVQKDRHLDARLHRIITFDQLEAALAPEETRSAPAEVASEADG